MDARSKSVRDILHTGDQYLVPYFQRFYSWQKKHWARLWDDVVRLVEDDQHSPHFLGPLVCIPTNHVPGEVPVYQLIDGQQRLTTLIILLDAIRDEAHAHGYDGIAAEIYEDYLVHKRKRGTDRFKVLPRPGDREALETLVEGTSLADQTEDRNMFTASRFMRQHVREFIQDNPKEKLNRLFRATASRLALVVITIDGENPYEIFESLNSTGLPLEESDLIRNYLFMQVPLEKQDEFYHDHWDEYERYLDGKPDGVALRPTTFYRDYLICHGANTRKREVFVDFQKLHKESKYSPMDHLGELRRFASFAKMIEAPPTVEDKDIGVALQALKSQDQATVHPLLLKLFDLREEGLLSRSELLQCLNDLVSFLLRRTICGESTKQYSKWFAELVRELESDIPEEVRNYLFQRGWPDDEAFRSDLVTYPLYHRDRKKCRLLLEAVEHSFGHKEPVHMESLTIEHVMPQTIDGRSAHGRLWQEMLGEESRQIHAEWLHTIGNLTLSGYNPDLSNRGFAEKRQLLVDSNLQLNKVFQEVECWDADTIQHRARTLAAKVADLFPRPANGPPYVRGSSGNRGKLTRIERRKLILNYFTELLALLHASGEFPKLPKPTDMAAINIRTGNRTFVLRVYLELHARVTKIILRSRGEECQARFKKLYAHKAEVEQELGHPLQWLLRQDEQRLSIVAWDNTFDVTDRDSWTTHHTWVRDRLLEMRRVFLPRINEYFPDKGPTRETDEHQEFWDELAQRMEDVEGLKPSANQSRGVRFTIGKSACTVRALASRKPEQLEVKFAATRKDGNRIFQRLIRYREEIEGEVGEELAWRDFPGKRRVEVALTEPGRIPTDENEQTELQDWFEQAILKMRDTVVHRVKSASRRRR